MSEQEHERPLTRRELREREQAAAARAAAEQGVDLAAQADVVETAASDTAVAESSAVSSAETPDVDGIEVEIDPFNEDGTPRTRRELRELRAAAIAAIIAERESAEAEAAAASSEPADVAEPAGADEAADAAEPAEVIDPDLQDSGEAEEQPSEAGLPDFSTLLSESFAATAAATSAEAGDMPEDEPETVEPETDAPVLADSAQVDVVDVDVDEVDADFGPPTEAYSLEELLEASEPGLAPDSIDPVEALFGTDDAAEQEQPARGLVEADLATPEHGDEKPSAALEAEDSDPAEDAAPGEEASSAAAIDLEENESSEAAEPGDLGESEQGEYSPEPEALEPDSLGGMFHPVSAVPRAGVDEDPESTTGDSSHSDWLKEDTEPDSDPADEPELKADTAAYSFPDIKPPEEWRSVFDDPNRAASVVKPDSTGDFDELISRAVAQEGSTEGSGDSALILPTHPGDTGGLTGPLGTTGELFVTGSIDLPKSLGETGGHAAIQDSAGFDLFLTGETTGAIESVDDTDPSGPVPALRAVSARRRPEVPVIAEPTKDKSKLPIILALAGGTLIVILAGAVIYAATQGLFG